jgi:hypothetical protein
MSKYYNKVLNYYTLGVWGISRVRLAVEKGWITEEEFTQITGEDY